MHTEIVLVRLLKIQVQMQSIPFHVSSMWSQMRLANCHVNLYEISYFPPANLKSMWSMVVKNMPTESRIKNAVPYAEYMRISWTK